MKTSILAAFSLAAVLLLSSLAGSPPQGSGSKEPQPSAPQEGKADRVAELEARVAGLEKALQAEHERVDGVLRYLEAQQRAAKSFDGSLDRVQELGFTKGINFSSRELLLQALHAQAKALQAPLPKASPKKKTAR